MIKTNDAIANVTLPVSMKFTVNIGRWIKGENVNKAIAKLELVLQKKLALPMVTHKKDTAHKRGIAAGRYPLKTIEHVLGALKLVKSNAKQKGFDESELFINEFIPNNVFSNNQRAKYKRGRLITLKVGVVVKK